MDITFDNIYKKYSNIFDNHTINISNLGWCDPWVIGLVCLKAIEYKDSADKGIIFPKDEAVLAYLKRLHLAGFLEKLTYANFLKVFDSIDVNERDNPRVQEIMHCEFRDDFEGRLSSRIRRMFNELGMNEFEGNLATQLVGELGNNVFDHNSGQWPTDVRGAVILAQHNPKQRRVEVVVADPGVGFLKSLKIAEPSLTNDIEAIKLGLSGVTGRTGERRGNGLKTIQRWTIDNFSGIVKIHSGSGLVIVSKDGQETETVFPILGTLASFVVKYK